MKLFPHDVTAEQIQSDLLGWLDMLAEGRYADAVDFLSPEIPDESGSTKETRWTPELLESVIANYGLVEPMEGEDWRYRVAPLTNELLPMFSDQLDIDLEMWENSTADGSRLAGAIHADLPLVYEDGPAMSDLTARFMFKRFPEGRMALVLLDIHVM